MRSGELDSVMTHIRRLAGEADVGALSDAALLRAFFTRRDEAAFEALLRRHGPLVLGLCRRVLRDRHDVDDAFQATFLVLVRNARAIRKPEALGSWLYGVAYRIAVRASARKRLMATCSMAGVSEPTGVCPPRSSEEWKSALDEELQRLPEKYRTPLVLHYLEGRTKLETAKHLGWTEGTVSGRLARGRDLLRGRLTRRGVGVPAATFAAALAGPSQAFVCPSLIHATAQIAVAMTAGNRAALPAALAALMEGATRTMFVTKLSLTLGAVLLSGIAGVGIGAVALPGEKGAEQRATNAAEPQIVAAPESASDQQTIQGTWTIAGAENNGQAIAPDQLRRISPTRFQFSDGKFTIRYGDKNVKGTYTIDPSREPKRIEIDLPDDKGRVFVGSGFYFLNDDSLKLSLGRFPGFDELSDFRIFGGQGLGLLALQRVKGDVAQDQKKAALDREAMARMQTSRNLKQIGLALHNYNAAYQHLPAAAITSKDGKPLLSWRVAILPFIDQNNLYKQFKLDEPWDSEHNKKMLATIPKVYRPVNPDSNAPEATLYQVFTGPDTPFNKNLTPRIPASFPDGTSNTFLVAEGGDAVPWTKPEDLTYQANKPLPKLGGNFKDGFYCVFADGSVHFINRKVNEKTLRALITPAGGEVIEFDQIKGR